MTLRTCWIFLLKIFGLKLLFIDLIPTFGQVPGMAFYVFYPNQGQDLTVLVPILSGLVVFVAIIWVFLFRPNRIVDVLKLDSGFDEPRITGNIHRSTVLFIVVAVICGMVLVDSLPRLITELIAYIRWNQRNALFSGAPESSSILLLLLKSALALIGITHPQWVVNWVEARRKKLAPDSNGQEEAE